MALRSASFGRRGFLLGCALLLAGCAQPKLTGDLSDDLAVVGISVQTAAMVEAVSGRPNEVTKEQLSADITQRLQARLTGRQGATKADLVVAVSEVQLVPRGVSALAPLQSTTKAVLSVTERGTGRVIVAPTEITATSAQIRLGGVLGVATAPTVAQDYDATLTGLVNAVEKRLYGEPE